MGDRLYLGVSLVLASIPGATINLYVSLGVFILGIGLIASDTNRPRGEGNRFKERKDGSASKER